MKERIWNCPMLRVNDILEIYSCHIRKTLSMYDINIFLSNQCLVLSDKAYLLSPWLDIVRYICTVIKFQNENGYRRRKRTTLSQNFLREMFNLEPIVFRVVSERSGCPFTFPIPFSVSHMSSVLFWSFSPFFLLNQNPLKVDDAFAKPEICNFGFANVHEMEPTYQ